MKQVTKSERLAKEAQIKSLIKSAMEYFYPEDLLEMLVGICDNDQMAGVEEKCKDVLCVTGGVFVAKTNLANESALKTFCKSEDIRLVDFHNNL